jgi:hypothetical protein
MIIMLASTLGGGSRNENILAEWLSAPGSGLGPQLTPDENNFLRFANSFICLHHPLKSVVAGNSALLSTTGSLTSRPCLSGKARTVS